MSNELEKKKDIKGETLNIFHELNFVIPDYMPAFLAKYGNTSLDGQVTEDAEFEIIQPKQLT